MEGGAEGGEGQAGGADALMDMSKLNTARIRKAVDPKIMDVKKRVRAARRKLKRDSKVRAGYGLGRRCGCESMLLACNAVHQQRVTEAAARESKLFDK